MIDLAALGDFAQTAGYVSQMDLLVTMNKLAHLAGGLGHPLWLMLGRQTDWRWMSGSDTTPCKHALVPPDHSGGLGPGDKASHHSVTRLVRGPSRGTLMETENDWPRDSDRY